MKIRLARLHLFTVIFAAATLALAQNGVDREMIRKIMDEGQKRSQLMTNFEYLTDMIGPRLTGSKKLKRANEWTAEKFREYGCENVHLEGFEFGRGWRRGIAYGRMTAPYEMQLDFRAIAWSPGTKGVVSGPVLVLDAKSPGDLDKYKGKLQGAIILPVPPPALTPDFHPHARRMNDKEFRELETSWPNGPPRAHGRDTEISARYFSQTTPILQKLQQLAASEMPALIITDSARDHSQFESGTGGSRDPRAPEGPPMVTMTHEHYSLLYRLAKRGVEVRVEMEARNYFEDDDTKSYNTVAEIRGSEKPDEVVILGAHLDSWDLGQGATDNGAGSMVVLEAARILKAVGARPKRTIRFILFGGEEQGLLGSGAYVQQHRAELAKISGVFVMDTGTGRLRGIGTEGNERVIPIFQEMLAPFKDLGVLYVNSRVQIGTDHISFHRQGVPGFAFFQDAIEYRSSTHHSQTDTLDKILPDDVIQASIVMAATAYHVAQLPELLPRK
jgi:carboxypeptidase Q